MSFISHRKSYVCHKYIHKSHVHTHTYLYICSHIHVPIQAKILQAQTHSVNGARYLKESSPTENNNKLPAELLTEVGEWAAWDRTAHKTKGTHSCGQATACTPSSLCPVPQATAGVGISSTVSKQKHAALH